jgi:acetyl-CoA carboxylase biotin carboxyl carrier protein
MVGTVYLAQSPEDPPFVKAGDTVREGQTLLLIEAMKTFNEVKAPRAGMVQSIAVASGQPVEFGEVLAIIE